MSLGLPVADSLTLCREAFLEQLDPPEKAPDDWKGYIQDPVAWVEDFIVFPSGENINKYQADAMRELGCETGANADP